MRRLRLRLSIVAAALAAAIAAPRPAHPQDPDALRARLAQLQQQETVILEHRNWWATVLRDPDALLLPADATTPWTSQHTMPRLMRRRDAIELANRIASALIAMRVWPPTTADDLMRDAEDQSNILKEAFRQGLMPTFERDLQAVRDEFQRLMQQRTHAGQAPPIAPPGRAWYFRRPVIGADRTGPDFTLLDSDADENGGHVQVRGRVPSTNCFETWDMRWKFGQNVSRLQQGMQIPVTLEVQLASAPCPSPLASFIAVGGSTTERIISTSAPSPVPPQGAIVEEGPRAAADGRTRYATTSALLKVEANPGQSNAWTMFRLQVYMPGQFWVVGYLYLAGGG
jgi:hypothetical protein